MQQVIVKMKEYSRDQEVRKIEQKETNFAIWAAIFMVIFLLEVIVIGYVIFSKYRKGKMKSIEAEMQMDKLLIHFLSHHLRDTLWFH